MSQDPLLTKGELGPYRIEKKLGQGAMGGVYLGFHRVLEVRHAIKVISPKLVGDETAVERFLREARNTAKLKHMNIVQVVGADEVNGSYYLAMEYVQGQTFDQLLRGDGLNLHDSVRYIHMIANALHYAHTRGIIHRDIKPANIMVNEEDIAKLMDFGLVRDIEPEQDAAEQLTMAGYIMGTPQYMPLEQWEGHGVDLRSDIYALGATLYVMLTGKLPYPGKNAREIFRNVLTGVMKSPREHNEEVDEELAAIVIRAMAPEKDDRYQSAEEMALDLEKWWDTHPYQGTSLFMAPVIEDTRGMTRGATSSGRSTTRAQLTHGSTVEGSTPTGLDVQTGSKLPLIIGIVLLVLIAGGVGAFLSMGGDDANGNTAPEPDPPTLVLEFDKGIGTEAAPLAVNRSQFSIPGSSNAEVTVNGKAYEFGGALSLKPGVSKFVVAATKDGKSTNRTLFVLLDQSPPVIALPQLEGREDNIIPTASSRFPIKGSVTDEGAGMRDLTATLRIDGDLRELALQSGEFEFDLPVDTEDVTVEIDAEDAAGNRCDTVTFWVVPDRNEPRFDSSWLPDDDYSDRKDFQFGGRLNKTRGVTLTVNGDIIDVSSDGSFRVDVQREPGEHTFEVVAKDWLGREARVTKTVTVDTEAPNIEVLEPEGGSILRVEELPVEVTVRGTLDDPLADLKVNGESVARQDDGSFTSSVSVSEFGELKIEVVAVDPGARRVSRVLWLDVKRLVYKLIGKNEQGYNEYERLTDGMTMIEIPGGTFTRGIEAGLPDAQAQEVELSSFLIAKYEVSNEQYAKFLNAKGVSADQALMRRWLTKDDSGFFHGLQPAERWSATAGEEKRPVVGVTWLGAQEYCKWADGKAGSLPTEAQWEYAARGNDGRTFPWGELPPNTARVNYLRTGRGDVADVDKFTKGVSPFGLFNTAGNVEEWCLDWYTEGAYALPGQQGKDPALVIKPNAVERRVVRGGSIQSPFHREPTITGEDEPGALQTFARSRRLPNTGAKDRGFRPVGKLPSDG